MRTLIIILIAGLLGGCTYFRPNLTKVQVKLDERTRENNSAAKIANDRALVAILKANVALESSNVFSAQLSLANAEEAATISGLFLRRNENLMGKPLEDQTETINRLTSTNAAIKKAEQDKQQVKEDGESVWRGKAEEYERKLIEMGTELEIERNKSIVKRFWGWLTATLGIGGIICLLVFFPFLIPIFFKIVGYIISCVPKLAHWLGVTSTKVLENTTDAIGSVRSELKKHKELSPDKVYSAAEVLEMLDTNLKISLDRDDKKVIEEFRSRLKK